MLESKKKVKYYGYFRINTLVRDKIKDKFKNALYKNIKEEDINKFLIKKIKEQTSQIEFFLKDKNSLITQIAECREILNKIGETFKIKEEEVLDRILLLNKERGSYSNLIIETICINEEEDPVSFKQYLKIYKLQKMSPDKIGE